MLSQPVTELKGIGPAKGALLQKLGISTVEELLYCMPRDYMDFSELTPSYALEHGRMQAVSGTVLSAPRLLRPTGGKELVSVSAADDFGGKFQAVWFNQPYRKNQLAVGARYVFAGRVDRQKGSKLLNPMVSAGLPGILAVYPLVQGLTQAGMRAAVGAALDLVGGQLQETLPELFRARWNLCERNFAITSLHRPTSLENVAIARRRLAFENMLHYMLAVSMLRHERAARPGIVFDTRGALERLTKRLPFALTGGQRRIAGEIAADMRAPVPMNRLVQGDVGSGKTVLALYAIQVAMENSYQGAMMAPTEILARQHYAAMCAAFGEEKCCLLTGGMRKKERDEAYGRISTGEAKAVAGTHALLQEGVTFARLGLVVTDEQHRFGVRQRAQIANKGAGGPPDVLIMSATPIPRTLSLILYGDLDVSVLDELPPGRKPIATRLVPPAKRLPMYDFIRREAAAGRQAYVVCPLVEQSESVEGKNVTQLHQELSALMPELAVGLLHGRMPAAKKEETIAAFRAGEIKVLVSTTVVEVGVDVRSATVMAIENADRFGLAQLHQLRGRVGRGSKHSYCFLLSEGEGAFERLEILTKTGDGFLIAQRDLELRGPGEFMGTRQHGLDDFAALQMAGDVATLEQAKAAAEELALMGETEAFAAVFAKARAVFEGRMREIAAN